MKPIVVQGKSFPSLTAAGRYYGIDQPTVSSRMAKGWTVEQVFGLSELDDSCSGLIYVITNSATGRKYVGITVRSLRSRMLQHRRDFEKGIGGKLYAAMKEFGLSCFSAKVVERVTSRRQLAVREKVWIETLDSIRNGYNSKPGGCGIFEIDHAIDFNGETIKSVREAAQRSGLNESTVRYRLARGLPITNSKLPSTTISGEYEGKPFSTIHELAALMGVKYCTAYYRYRRDMNQFVVAQPQMGARRGTVMRSR